MANKLYTAQEMREMAGNICRVDAMDGLTCRENSYPIKRAVRAMLLQVADALEREEKHVKKYEYAGRLYEGTPSSIHFESQIYDKHYFRREVGEWEEIVSREVEDGK